MPHVRVRPGKWDIFYYRAMQVILLTGAVVGLAAQIRKLFH